MSRTNNPDWKRKYQQTSQQLEQIKAQIKYGAQHWPMPQATRRNLKRMIVDDND